MNVIVINGVKYYPLCSWENNQHRFYHACDVWYVKYHDDPTDENEERYGEVCTLKDLFDSFPQRRGIVYTPWDFRDAMKEIIRNY